MDHLARKIIIAFALLLNINFAYGSYPYESSQCHRILSYGIRDTNFLFTDREQYRVIKNAFCSQFNPDEYRDELGLALNFSTDGTVFSKDILCSDDQPELKINEYENSLMNDLYNAVTESWQACTDSFYGHVTHYVEPVSKTEFNYHIRSLGDLPVNVKSILIRNANCDVPFDHFPTQIYKEFDTTCTRSPSETALLNTRITGSERLLQPILVPPLISPRYESPPTGTAGDWTGNTPDPGKIPYKGEQWVPNSTYATESGLPLYEVWFGTNRKLVKNLIPSKSYSDETDNQINYGRVYVEVPKSHQIGSLGSSWIKRNVFGDDDLLKLNRVEALKEKMFFELANKTLSERKNEHRTVLVFLHGFNVSFENAALRAAQIGYDLKIDGITTFFSWASRGDVKQYSVDEATITASELYLEIFLTRLSREIDAKRIDIIAHSMGNRALLRVAERMARKGVETKFGHIILAAPDVDARTFKHIAKAYTSIAQSTTLYVSKDDHALGLSKVLHGSPRAGHYPPLTIIQDIDTIKVTDVDLSLLGHGYVAEAKEVLADIRSILKSSLSPEKRSDLNMKGDIGQRHWELQ